MKFFDRFKARLQETRAAKRWKRWAQAQNRVSPLPDKSRRDLARFLMAGAAAAGTALAPSAAGALQLQIRPPMQGSSIAGQLPGSGVAPMGPGGVFLNDADGNLAWADSSGAIHPINLSLLKSPRFFGALGAPADDSIPLQKWLTAGGGVLDDFTYLHSVPLNVPAGCKIIGNGQSRSVIRFAPASGSAVRNGMLTERTSVTGNVGLLFKDFTYDHNAASLTDPTTSPRNDPLFGLGIAIRTSNTRVIGCAGLNSWDIMFNVIDFDETSSTPTNGTNPPVAGMPKFINFDDVYTSNCGCGVHAKVSSVYNTIPGKVGGGIINASGQYVTINNPTDYLSYGCWGTDTGGGANYTYISDATSQACQADPNNQTTQVVPASGTPFFLNVGRTWISNCGAEYPGAFGIFNGDGNEIEVTNFYVRGAGRNGVREAGFGRWTNVVVENASQTGAGLYDSILVQEASVSLAVYGPTWTNCHSIVTDGKARYGYNEIPVAPHTIASEIIGGTWQGATQGFGVTTASARIFAPGYLISIPGVLKSGPSNSANRALQILGQSGSVILGPDGAADIALQPGSASNKIGLYGAVLATGTFGATGLPTSATGLAAGQFWRDNSTTPPTLRIV